MKTPLIILILLLSIALSSCNTYYYGVVQSYENRVPQNDDGSFTAEKDDVFITYSFVNQGGSVVYNIYNQSEDPVFVDWGKSVLIAEDQALQYSRGTTKTKTYQFSDSSRSVQEGGKGVAVEKIVIPQDALFVPPHSRVSYSPILLYDVYNMKLPASAYQKVQVGGTTIKGVYFTPQNSPLLFRSYLTIVNSKTNAETVFEDIFYISSSYKTLSKNDILMRLVRERGDTFYDYEMNSGAKVLGWTAAIGLVVVAIVLAPEGEYVDTIDYY